MRYLFLLNPAAGREDCTERLRLQAEGALRRAGIPREAWAIRRTEYRGHARALAEAAAREGGPVRIYAAGGDGTFRRGAGRRPPLSRGRGGLYPHRQRQRLSAHLWLKAGVPGPGRPAGRRRRPPRPDGDGPGPVGISLRGGPGRPGGRRGIRFRHNPLFHGEAAYLLSAAREICGPIGRQMRFTVDGETFEAPVMMCAACNTRDYGGGFRAAPAARPDDGLIDLIVVRRISRATLLRLFNRYKQGRHFAGGQLAPGLSRYLIYRQARHITIELADGRGPITATADGECAEVSRLEIRLAPLAARVILPAAVCRRQHAAARQAAV